MAHKTAMMTVNAHAGVFVIVKYTFEHLPRYAAFNRDIKALVEVVRGRQQCFIEPLLAVHRLTASCPFGGNGHCLSGSKIWFDIIGFHAAPNSNKH